MRLAEITEGMNAEQRRGSGTDPWGAETLSQMAAKEPVKHKEQPVEAKRRQVIKEGEGVECQSD